MNPMAQVGVAGMIAQQSVAAGWAMTAIQMWAQGEFANMKLMATLHEAICKLQKAIGEACKALAQ
jgi:hypothetical protein